ncbi:MAG: hypothetical protein AABY45_03895 [Deltaproteobacteria bacterium]
MTKGMPKLIYLLVCDDIRQEMNEKLSFIGVYTNNTITVPVIPITLPQFQIFSMWDSSKERITYFKFKITQPDGNTVVQTESARKPDAHEVTTTTAIHVGLSPFTILSTGEYKLDIEINGHPHELGTLKVSLTQPVS